LRNAQASPELLTLTTGVIDAASYLGLGHVFTANMTGKIALLAFGMGVRNATVRRLKVADLTTTVLTMTLTGDVPSPCWRCWWERSRGRSC
jgi:uncharacterized membrane protein YoaK (UPF0700 family)